MNNEHRSAALATAGHLSSIACSCSIFYPYMDEGEYEEDESSIFLPDDIIVTEILPRLHIKTLFRFKCASKQYPSIISDSVFGRNYMRRAYDNDNSSGLLATFVYPFTNFSTYRHGLSVNVKDLTETLNSSTQFCNDRIFVSSVSLPYHDSHQILASSNGLLLSHFRTPVYNPLSKLTQIRTSVYLTLCVSNPLTKQCLKLPNPSMWLNSFHWDFFIVTRRVEAVPAFLTYKVVAIQTPFDSDQKFTTVRIFSSDTGSWVTWKAWSENVSPLPKGGFAYKGILHFLDTDNGSTSVLTYDPYDSPDRFNQIPLPSGGQFSQSWMICSGDEEMLKYCEVDDTVGCGIDRLTIWRLVDSDWCLEGKFLVPSVLYECKSLMVAPNPWNRDVICHPYVMESKFMVVNPRAGTLNMVGVFDDQTIGSDIFPAGLTYKRPLILLQLCPWSSPCYAPMPPISPNT